MHVLQRLQQLINNVLLVDLLQDIRPYDLRGASRSLDAVRMASNSKKKPPTTSSDGHESHRWREGAAAPRDAEIARYRVLAELHHVLPSLFERLLHEDGFQGSIQRLLDVLEEGPLAEPYGVLQGS